MNQTVSKILKKLIPLLMVILISTIGYILLNGIPIRGIPQIDTITSVEILDQHLSPEERFFNQTQEIEKAHHAAHLLLAMPGKAKLGEPVIDLVFHQQDGSAFTLQANEETVWVKGKAYRLRGDSGPVFIKVIEAMFFYEELAETQS